MSISRADQLLHNLRRLSTQDDLVLPIHYEQSTFNERRLAREQYTRDQKGLCWYCKKNLHAKPPRRITKKLINWGLFPVDFRSHPIHLQHDHVTGLTEGAVHAYCNAVLWEYEGK